jgi:acetate kinase
MIVFVVNCGSSSVKARLVDTATGECVARSSVDRLADPASGIVTVEHRGQEAQCRGVEEDTHVGALRLLREAMPESAHAEAVGHRVVHGGEKHRQSVVITREVVEEIGELCGLAPLHNPPSLAGIRGALELFPDLPQVAVFDTAFHASIPDHAYRYAVPERLYTQHGVRRYGFHGISHRYVADTAARMLRRDDLRLVSLHLGNGCSAAAIRGHVSLDTSMGMTPLEGLIMGTRSGDIDPALPELIGRLEALSPGDVTELLTRESGLGALSGGMVDMRDIESARATDDRARLAFEAFCYRVRKYVGAYASVLGGLDVLAFTGGIGENSAAIRATVCGKLGFLGVQLDPDANSHPAGALRDIAQAEAPARVLVVAANEELVIARETEATLTGAARSEARQCS